MGGCLFVLGFFPPIADMGDEQAVCFFKSLVKN